MIRKLRLVLFANFLYTLTIAQVKNDYNWILGYPPNKPESFFGGVLLDFNKDLIFPEYFNISHDSGPSGVLSDQNGQLLLYSNGCSIIGIEHEPIANGDTIGFGYVWESYCDVVSYPGTQNNLILQFPGDSNRAIVFYKFTTEDFFNNKLYYANIVFNEDFPKGVVTSKDHLLVDPGSSALITATQHANGRDWWLILPDNATNRFYIMLLDPSGVAVVDTQAIGNPWEEREWASQAVFTPDGSKYIRANPWKGVDIFDFDRCTGTLSNPLESGPLSDPVRVGCGAGVSVDSRFLYVSNVTHLYQFDLWDPDILSTQILIDTFDGYINPFPTTFYQMLLAPDGKLYMFSTNGVKSIHVIHHSERSGVTCGFKQHGIELPAYEDIGSPNIPYFRLGPLEGSLCDTLEISKSPIADFRYEIDSLSPFLVRFKDLSYYHPETWHWDFGGGEYSDDRIPAEMHFGGHGTYPVCLTVSNAFGEHTFCRTIILGDTATSINNGHSLPAIRLYPNPADNILYLDVPNLKEDVTVTFYSIMGSEKAKYTLTSDNWEIDVSTWMTGIYLFSIYVNGYPAYAGKVIKY